MKKTLLVLALFATTSALAQNTPRAPTKEAPEILAEAATAMIFGPIATAYALSVGPWAGEPLRGVEDRYKEVCEKVLLGKWLTDAPGDKCPTGNWLNVWRFKS